jgi:DNA transposition AAA+ family ATPase
MLNVAALTTERRAGPPPSGPALSPVEIDEIRSWGNEYKNTKGLSLPKMAALIGGVAPSTLGLFLDNKYPADDESNVALKIVDFRDRVEQRDELGGAAEFVKTSVAAELHTAFLAAESIPGFAICALGAGMGKSRALYEWKLAKKNAHNMVIVSLSPDCKGPAALLTEIYAAMTKRSTRNSNHLSYIRREIVSLLRGRALYVDEAQYLDEVGVDLLRCIAGESPLVLVGNERTYEGQVAGSTPAYMQFSSRVVARVFLSPGELHDRDIKLVALQLAPKAFIESCLDILVQQAKSGGAFRVVDKIVKRALLNAQLLDQEPDRDHVLLAMKQMQLQRPANGKVHAR